MARQVKHPPSGTAILSYVCALVGLIVLLLIVHFTAARARESGAIQIVAVLCSLSAPESCHEQIVTTSDFADISLQSCMMGMPQLAEWMKAHPSDRLAKWRCVIGPRSSGI